MHTWENRIDIRRLKAISFAPFQKFWRLDANYLCFFNLDL